MNIAKNEIVFCDSFTRTKKKGARLLPGLYANIAFFTNLIIKTTHFESQ